MKNSLKKLIEDKFVKNIFTLSIGTIAAQFILLAISPIITRLYTPKEFGAYSTILAFITMFIPVMNGRYDMAIVSADSDKEANKIAILSILIGFIITFIVGVLLFVYLKIYNTAFLGIGHLALLSLPILLINVLVNVLNSYNNRFGHYKLMATVSMVRSMTQAVGQVGLGLLKLGTLGLLITQIVGLIVGVRKQAQFALGIVDTVKEIKYKDLSHLMKKHLRQPLFSAPAILMNAMSYSVITLLISSLYSLEDAGYYAISLSIVGAPLTFVTSSVARVFFAYANEEKKLQGNFHNTFRKTTRLLVGLLLPFFIILMIFAERTFENLFGAGWSKAGVFVVILSPMFAVRCVTSTLSLSLVVANKQKAELIFQFLFLMEAVINCFVVEHLNLSIEYFLGLISASYFITYTFWFYYMLTTSKQEQPVVNADI